MTLTEHNIEALTGSQEQFATFVHEQLRQAVRLTLMNVLEEEVEAVIGAQRYERTEQRRDQRNGHGTNHGFARSTYASWTSNAGI